MINPQIVQRCVPLLLCGVVFGVYLITTSPVVYLGDSGEFTAAAFSLGIPHNSGYPLYSLIGKIFCLIPLGNVGFRMNVMSAIFCALAVFLVYDIIFRMTRCTVCALTAAGYLAFTPLFWSQTVSAEVYPLHSFFLLLMIRLLWQWDQSRSFHHLLLFVFVTGLSFGNHMQTVMLAAPVLYFIISGDRKAIFTVKHFAAITACFLIPLMLYLYLPIRTQAGAAIHWGDPDNLERFMAHVTASAHRGAYVFSGGLSQYQERFVDALRVMADQYGVLLLISICGWVWLRSLRWKIFFAGVVLFDLVYTVFLNIISLEITPFTLPSSIVMAILLGIGINLGFDWVRRQKKVGPTMRRSVAVAAYTIVPMSLITNFSFCDQSRNYTAYEHAVNIFRTPPDGSTILLDGDNNIFPVSYGRIVEGMGDGITLYDRPNVIFKWRPSPVGPDASRNEPALSDIDNFMNSRADQGLYFASVNPFAVAAPQHLKIEPCGILKKVVSPGEKRGCPADIWGDYATASFYADFHRDYMNREVASYFFFRKGESLWDLGKYAETMQLFGLASQIGYNDTSIHSDLGVFYTDQGLFDHARRELEKALLYHDSLSGVHNNWGYYYHKTGEYPMAIASFKKAIELSPQNFAFHNNLGLSLLETGKMEEARLSFRRSLLINQDQPTVEELMKKHDLK